ncbi:MAG: NADH-quinone oxidoreductase subunit J [Candidatus Kapabacteria bacterium]|nr:NADH-quinone oxidoreductase subunit J [Candidatus Kapabacteria bacterium]
MIIDFIIFGILGTLAIASALVTISTRHPIVSAMSLVLHFFMLAGIYLTLQAQFIAVLQILVYAGAIMVLVIFVIMLLNLSKEEHHTIKVIPVKAMAILFSIGFALELVTIFLTNKPTQNSLSPNALQNGTAEAISKAFFTSYLVPFEAIGLLLLAAIIGAVILAKRRINQ